MLMSAPAFSQLRSIHRVFTDVEERYAELPYRFWDDYRVRRLTSEHFESCVTAVHGAQFRFGGERFQGCTRVQGALAQDALYLGFLDNIGFMVANGQPQPPGLLIIGPGAGFDAAFHATRSHHSMTVRGAVLTRLLEGENADGVDRRWLAPGLHRPRANALAVRRLRQLLIDLTDLSASNPAALLQPGVLTLAQDDLLAAARLALAIDKRDVTAEAPSAAPRRRALALAAEELIDFQPNQALSLAAICKLLNTSERTLQLAFQEQFGVGFRVFLRAMRLQQARAALVRAGDRCTIAEIAMEYGFWHLGRFTQYYREMFGCTPSATQRLATMRVQARA